MHIVQICMHHAYMYWHVCIAIVCYSLQLPHQEASTCASVSISPALIKASNSASMACIVNIIS